MVTKLALTVVRKLQVEVRVILHDHEVILATYTVQCLLTLQGGYVTDRILAVWHQIQNLWNLVTLGSELSQGLQQIAPNPLLVRQGQAEV